MQYNYSKLNEMYKVSEEFPPEEIYTKEEVIKQISIHAPRVGIRRKTYRVIDAVCFIVLDKPFTGMQVGVRFPNRTTLLIKDDKNTLVLYLEDVDEFHFSLFGTPDPYQILIVRDLNVRDILTNEKDWKELCQRHI